MTEKKKELLRTVKFVLFSISAGLIQVVSFTLMEELLQVTHWVAYLTALVLSVLWNFTLNRKFTFCSANNVPVAMLKVAVFYAVFTPFSTWWTAVLTDNGGWNEYLVLALTMLVNFVLEYLYQRFFVFGNSLDTAKTPQKEKNMLTNFHTHTTFCDGKNTPEEMVQSAMKKGFTALGFSGHGMTTFDPGYCMKDVEGYRAEILRLKEAYQDRITIYLGAEEDCLEPVDRSQFEYIIGSSHYVQVGEKIWSVDSKRETFQQLLALFDGDPVKLAEAYYSRFCAYIRERKPDIIGHFDLITKFSEVDAPNFTQDTAYLQVAEKYIREAAESGCVFEVNTGAIARGLRTTPYPCVQLLRVLKELDARLILSSDSHRADTIDCAFAATKALLRDIGFTQLVTMNDGGFVPYDI